ncbi:MAG: hypothetical protein R3E39_19665 [Anaerolineae bacterium]
MYRTVGHNGWGHRGWHSHYGHRGPRGFFFFPIFPFMLIGMFLFFGLFKFLFPLILIGVGIAFFSRMMRGGFHGGPRPEFWNRDWNWDHNWHNKLKRKNDWSDDSKPKRGEGDDDSPRYARTANGDWVEIV